MRDMFLLTSLACLLAAGPAAAQTAPSQNRGALLYSTHCIACHTEQVHWRDRKRVTDWRSLRSEIRRWQEIMGLGWNREDIDEVAQYLNILYYHDLASELR